MMFDSPDRTPREAVIALIRDMLDDEHGRSFVEAAVSTFAIRIIDLAKKSPPSNAHDREWLTFARLIADDAELK
jgi:hypothetical protein